MSTTADVATTPAPAHARGRGWRRAAPVIGTLPFFGYVTIFLLIPAVIVIVGSFYSHGSFTWANIKALTDSSVISAFIHSVILSAATALIGGIAGGMLAYALVTGAPDSFSRKLVTAASSVLAQFGGVMLAFAFIATVGSQGMVTNLMADWLGVNNSGVWLYSLTGLILVYSYFQVPLMVIVFLPAVDGIRAQWREATETLGGSTWTYWRKVAGPLLAPAFFGSLLLLFANAFSSYATAAALITQSNPIVPLQISGALTNEVNVNVHGIAKSLSLGMVIIVAIVMSFYARLQKRTERWLQ